MKGILKKLAKWVVAHGIDELNKEIDSHNVRREPGTPPVPPIPTTPSSYQPPRPFGP